MDLRCEHKMLGRIAIPSDGGVIELKCSSRFCGAGSGVVVLHHFSTKTGALLGTRKYRDTPIVERKVHGER